MSHRDATEAELVDEPDAVLEAMAAGQLGVTRETMRLAEKELDRRKAEHESK